jgi:hypothetical protein
VEHHALRTALLRVAKKKRVAFLFLKVHQEIIWYQMSRTPNILRATFAFKNASDWVNLEMFKNPFKYSIDIAKMSIKDPIQAGYMTTGAGPATAPGVLFNYGKATIDPTYEYSFQNDTKRNPNAVDLGKEAQKAADANSAIAAQAASVSAAKSAKATATARDNLLKQQTILGQSANRAGASLYTA